MGRTDWWLALSVTAFAVGLIVIAAPGLAKTEDAAFEQERASVQLLQEAVEAAIRTSRSASLGKCPFPFSGYKAGRTCGQWYAWTGGARVLSYPSDLQ